MPAKRTAKDSLKQVVYVDAQDDIACLIEAIEASQKNTIALVLPKRPEILSSIVNMKLLRGSGLQFKKKIVLVTTDRAVVAIAANLKMYVSASLVSAPAVPKEDVPVVGTPPPVETPKEAAPETEQPLPKVKVPNFSRFVKRMLLAVAILVVLPLVWFVAFRVLPKATIIIETNSELLENVSLNVELSTELNRVDADRTAIPFYLETYEQTISQIIQASGEKEVGAYASGLLTIKNCSDESVEVATNHSFTAEGLTYTNQAAVSLTSGNFDSSGDCKDTGNHVRTVTITAQEVGEQYNFPDTRTYSSNLAVGAEGYVVGSAMSGGSQEIVKFVTQANLDEAISALELKRSDDDARERLEFNLSNQDLIVLGDTFNIAPEEVESDVEVDQESEEGVLSQTIVYQLGGISRQDLQGFLHPVIAGQSEGLQLVDDGLDEGARYTLRVIDEQTYDLNVSVDAQVGFSLDVETIFEQVKGKPADQIAQELRAKDGIDTVAVSVTPPWTNNVPSDRSKVIIEINDID